MIHWIAWLFWESGTKAPPDAVITLRGSLGMTFARRGSVGNTVVCRGSVGNAISIRGSL